MAIHSRWLSRAAAIGLLLAVVAVAYALTVAPLIAAYKETDEAIARATDLLARYQQVTAQRDALEDQFDELAARRHASGVYLRGDTDALAAAELQEIVNSTVESGGGRLRSTQILPTRTDGELRRVGVRVQMTANIAALARILYTFEAGDIFLFIDNLDISNRRARRRSGEIETDPELLVRLDLSGYVRPGAAG